MTQQESDDKDSIIAGLMVDANDVFEQMCQERHAAGSEEYGPAEFLNRDTLTMAMEEVADLANYARYTFIKLYILREKLKEQSGGIGTFERTGQ